MVPHPFSTYKIHINAYDIHTIQFNLIQFIHCRANTLLLLSSLLLPLACIAHGGFLTFETYNTPSPAESDLPG
jgi:hypothetical protein